MSAKIAYLGGPDLSLRIPLIKRLLKKGYEAHAIGSNEAEEALFAKAGIPFIHYPLEQSFAPLADLRSLISLIRVFRKERFALIHAFDSKPTIVGRIAAGLAGISIIIGTIPGIGSLFAANRFSFRILRLFYYTGQKIACSISQQTVFQNQDDLRFFTSKRLLNPEKGVIIRGSGVDTDQFSKHRLRPGILKRTRAELKLGSKSKNVFMITRILRAKGVDEYLAAAEQLTKEYRSLRFYLVGPMGADKFAFPLQEIENHDFVTYVGARKDIPEILSLADIVVLPTYYREGIPRILLEAACMEKPIVTTNVPGAKEVVEDSVTGYVIPPRDSAALAKAISVLVENRRLGMKMGRKGREKIIKEFSLNIVFKKTVSLYEDLLRVDL